MAAIAAALTQAQPAGAVQRIAVGCQSSPAVRLCSIHQHLRLSNQLRHAFGLRSQPYAGLAETHPRLRDAILTEWVRGHRRALERWQAYEARPAWLREPFYGEALCIHHFEGAWNDPNAPYWGGMQMDFGFQQSYGPEYLSALGTADHWPPVDQLHAAYRGWLMRGWSPWPTASLCGLG